MNPRNPNADRGDDGDDMRASWSLEDTEAVLRGHIPESADAARLVPAIAALQARAHGTVNAAAVAAMATTLAQASLEPATGAKRSQARAGQPTTRSAATWRRRVSLAGVIALLGSAGLAATAAAADGAAPGDALYSVDRALESVGIGSGGSRERLSEAEKLVDEGEVDAALHHVAEALQGEGDDSSSAALVAAAEQLAANGSENSAEVHARVAEMLRWMSEADVKGSEFGQTVSDYARGLGDPNADSADDPATPGNSGGDPGSNDHGNSQDRPDGPGKSGDAGEPKQEKEDVSSPSGGSEGRSGKGSGG